MGTVDQIDKSPPLLGIGAAAMRAGVSERALRYYQELGLITPSGRSPGGLRRYSESDLDRVARIRELQSLLGLDLDEIAVVLRSEDRLNEIRQAYQDEMTDQAERKGLLQEYLANQAELKATVEIKLKALAAFLADIDERIGRVEGLIASGADS